MKRSAMLMMCLLLAVVLVCPGGPLRGEERTLAPEKTVRALASEISGEIAYRYTSAISSFDRVQASDGWHAAAEYIQRELERLGYKGASIEGWPSDGTLGYGSFRSVIGWRTKSAELRMVSPVEERLCSFEEVPLTLVKHSGPGHVQTELADVGSGMNEACYAGREVRGRIVLAYGTTAVVMNEAVIKRGALGVLSYYAPDVRPGYPNMIRYTGLWPRWEDREKLGFAFNLTKDQGARLKRMLEEGVKVVLRADVDTEFYKTRIEVLSTVFPGTEEPDREVIIVGHLCHPAPSANDNGSGSAVMLEAARVLKKLVDSGAIPAPRRTIRFLWVPEFNGLMPYVVAHQDEIKKSLAVVNCDMVGEDLHKTGGAFSIYSTPNSLPSFLNDVTADFALLAERMGLLSLNGSSHPFFWKLVPYSGGSDHVVFNDGSIRVPSVMLGRDDVFHHTSLDNMDKVDPTELRRSAFIALGTAYYLAAAGDAEAVDTARLVARNGYSRLAASALDEINTLYAASDGGTLDQVYRRAMNGINQAIRKEIEAVRSVSVLTRSIAAVSDIAAAASPLEAALLSLPKEADKAYRKRSMALGVNIKPLSSPDSERALARLIPARTGGIIGPVENEYLAGKLDPPDLAAVGALGEAAYEALNFVDGRRTMQDIYLALSVEYNIAGPDVLRTFFESLKKAGIVELKKI